MSDSDSDEVDFASRMAAFQAKHFSLAAHLPSPFADPATPSPHPRGGRRGARVDFRVPAGGRDDRDALSSWAEAALAAARRGARRR